MYSYDSYKLFELYMTMRSYEKIKSSIKKNKIDINKIFRNGLSPLHMAINKKDEKLVTILLNKGANVNILNSEGDTPLNYISTHCDDNKTYKCRIFEKLLQFGANCNHVDSFDMWPPLKTTFYLKKYNFFELLLKYNANVEYHYKDGNTILHLVIFDTDNKYLLLLVKYAINLEMKNFDNKTALIVAMENNRLIHVRTLLDYDAKIQNDNLQLVQKYLNNLSTEHRYGYCSHFLYHLFKRCPNALDSVSFPVPPKFSHHVLEMQRMRKQRQNNEYAGYSCYSILMKDIKHTTIPIYVTDEEFDEFRRNGKKKIILKYPFFGAIIVHKIKLAYGHSIRSTTYMKLYFYIKKRAITLPKKFIDIIITSLINYNDF